ncbi:PEGA domain-containing protein [Thermosipho atlanticus]|uniref:PEGA domain-containing protein n=1 Tax=Thermosipho atlanticus DSM 15807 TaxID=1123380 RepID=A0A1M5R4E5_9BACT|nr:PEGA domain-containing protein [Thermosipho atlanticus]SHH21277.1 PEGA domain-containing protein [Thermosipho atlanticus DSM 15807]
MRKLLVFILIILSLIIFAGKISFTIFIGYPPEIPEYGLWIETNVPYANVYINGYFVGQTNAFGYIILVFEEEEYLNIKIDAENYVPFTKTVYIEKSGLRMYVNLEKAGKLMVFSNIYPVNVYLNGSFYGTISDETDVLKLPSGEHKLILTTPGYEYIEKKLFLDFKEVEVLHINFKPKKLEMNILTDYTEFSPNNDWYRDTWNLKIYLSTYATIRIEIIKKSTGEVVYEKTLNGKPNYNIFTWKGENADDGVYLVRVVASNGKEKVERNLTVIIDRTKYFYIKQIFFISIISLLMLSLIGL